MRNCLTAARAKRLCSDVVATGVEVESCLDALGPTAPERIIPCMRTHALVSLAGAVAASTALLLSPHDACADEPVRTLDLRSLFSSSPPDIESRRQSYDTLVAAACVQGIANRAAPNLYLFYTLSVVDGSIDTDQLWWDRLNDPGVGGGVIAGRPIEALVDLDAAIDAYAPLIQGLAVWDERVPATVNAAFAAAGAQDLIAVRWDASPASQYKRLSARFPVVVSLVGADGSSRFLDDQGTALVPDTTRQTSQSAKADSYVWTLENLSKVPGTVSPTEFGWMLDATWIANPNDYAGNPSATNQWQLPNRDWLIAKRGIPFDLSPWDDVAATDDPGQPVGTDPAILRELLSAGRAAAGDEAITIRGFFAWQFKYTDLQGLPADHHPVMGEWTGVRAVSPYAAGLDADAPGMATMANASFYMHVPLEETPAPQRRPTAEDLVGEGFLSGLAPNGGFEDGESSWVMHVTNHVVYTEFGAPPARSHGGLRFLECNTTAVGDDLQDNLYRDGAPAAPGQRVTLRAFVRAPGGPTQGELVIWAMGGTLESISVPFTADSTWKEVRATLDVAQAGHTSTRGQLYLRTANSNLDVDDVAFYVGDPSAGAVEPANYTLWFVGDYDAAAWLYAVTPVTWDRPGRGIVPFAWDFSGQLASRFPIFFRHALATRTERDFFIGADSGPGYGNPSQMDAQARAIWAKAGVRAARRLDVSSAWILNPLDPVDATHLGAVTPFCGDGVLLMAPPGGVAVPSIVDHAPIVALDNLAGDTVAGMAASVLGGAPAPSQPAFRAWRVVLKQNSDLVDVSRDLVDSHSDRKVRFVDPFTFFYLARKQMGGDNAHRASYTAVQWDSPVASGQMSHVTLRVRNDGWETWRAAPPNQYRLGLHVADKAPDPRALPSDPAGYPVRLSLPHDVIPGAEVELQADLPPRTEPRTYVVQADMVEEGVTWFETAGDIPLQRSLVVSDTAADAGTSDAAADAAGADAGQDGSLDASADATKPSDAGQPEGGGLGDSGAHGAGSATGDDGCGCEVAVGSEPAAGSLGLWGLLVASALLRTLCRGEDRKTNREEGRHSC